MNDTFLSAWDPLTFRRVLGHYPSGVAAITSNGPEGRPIGMVVSSFTSVSLDPPLVAFLPAKASTSWRLIRESGAFCVNVLGADQESICRQIAGRGDKFEGVAWSPDASGLPALSGAVAWIACEIEAVHDAGDHDIVVGRVRHLDVDDSVVPLLFFQGGYGRFASSSISAISEGDIVEHLRLVHDIHPRMREASVELGVEVLVIGLAGDELVILATSGHPDATRLPTRVGQRMPFVPPLGGAVAAFTDPEAWLDRGNLDDDSRAQLRSGIERTRARGWSATVSSTNSADLDGALLQMSPYAPTTEQMEAARHAVNRLGVGYEPESIEPGQEYPLRSVTVPVLSADGRARLVITAYGLPPSSRLEDLERHVERLRALAGTIELPATVLGR